MRIVFFILFPDWGNFNQKGWYYVCFSLFFYYLALKGLLMNFKPIQIFQNSVNEELKETPNQYTNLSSENEDWKRKIIHFVKEEQHYKNQELTLLNVAKALQTNTTLVSNIINKGFEMNFNDFINSCRIEAFKGEVISGKHENMTLLGLAYDCGFNSKTTFNRSFKKFTGQTPKEFLETKKNSTEIGFKS